ncbi:MAG: DUF1697 domain-containing protein [Balneolaceae bacterium]
MKPFIALFRGINVGGKNVLPMKELRGILENLGLENVQTYIQSGNVVFESDEKDLDKLSGSLSRAIKESHGFEPNVMILSHEDFKQAIQQNPFPEAEADPKTLHLSFLKEKPLKPDLNGLDSVKADSEKFILKGKVFYLHAPEGIGRSKLAAKAEKLLGVSATARNWRTVSKIAEMMNQD